MPWVPKHRTTEAERQQEESMTRPSLNRNPTISSFLDFGETKSKEKGETRSHLEDAVANFGSEGANSTTGYKPQKPAAALPAAEPLPSTVAQKEDNTTDAKDKKARSSSMRVSAAFFGDPDGKKKKKKKRFYGGEERTKTWNSKVLNEVDGVIIRQKESCCGGTHYQIYAIPKQSFVPVQPTHGWVVQMYQQHTALLTGVEESDWWERAKCPMSFQAVIKFYKERPGNERRSSTSSTKKPEFYIYRPSRASCCYPCTRTICAKPSLKLLDSHLRTVISVDRTDTISSCVSPTYSARDGEGTILHKLEVPFCTPAKQRASNGKRAHHNACPFLGPTPCTNNLEVDFFEPNDRYMNSSYFVYSKRWGCLLDSEADIVISFPVEASAAERGALIASNMLVRYDVLTEHIERQKLPQKLLGTGLKQVFGMGAPDIAEMER